MAEAATPPDFDGSEPTGVPGEGDGGGSSGPGQTLPPGVGRPDNPVNDTAFADHPDFELTDDNVVAYASSVYFSMSLLSATYFLRDGTHRLALSFAPFVAAQREEACERSGRTIVEISGSRLDESTFAAGDTVTSRHQACNDGTVTKDGTTSGEIVHTTHSSFSDDYSMTTLFDTDIRYSGSS